VLSPAQPDFYREILVKKMLALHYSDGARLSQVEAE
jgi:hypothetical protein